MKKLILILLFLFVSNVVFSQSGWNFLVRFLYNPKTYLHKTVFINENVGFSVGYRGSNWVIYKTTNGGYNWSMKAGSSLPPRYRLYSVFFINNNTGFVVGGEYGYGSILMKTTNQGQDWIDQNLNISSSYRSFDISFIDENTGYIIGSGGLILKTTNGANNWQQLNSGTSSTLTRMQIPSDNNNNIYIVGESSFFLKSTNAGANWNLITFPPNDNIRSISFTNSNVGYVAGGLGISPYCLVLYKTTNSGNNWINLINNIPHPFQSSGKVCFVNRDTGFVGALQTYRTTNGGMNWRLQESFGGGLGQYSYRDIFFLNQTFGIITGGNLAGYNCYLLKTTTGGEGVPWGPHHLYCTRKYAINRLNWNDSSITESGFKIQRKNLTDTLWQTIDSVGANILQYNDSNSTADVNYRVCAYNEYGNSGYSNIVIPIILNVNSQVVIVNYTLHQNYPNPFNPKTNIRFNIPKSSHVELIIYGVLGREVTTLVNKKLSAGSYETEWSGNNYSSGVYFYTLITKSFKETKRMLLIK